MVGGSKCNGSVDWRCRGCKGKGALKQTKRTSTSKCRRTPRPVAFFVPSVAACQGRVQLRLRQANPQARHGGTAMGSRKRSVSQRLARNRARRRGPRARAGGQAAGIAMRWAPPHSCRAGVSAVTQANQNRMPAPQPAAYPLLLPSPAQPNPQPARQDPINARKIRRSSAVLMGVCSRCLGAEPSLLDDGAEGNSSQFRRICKTQRFPITDHSMTVTTLGCRILNITPIPREAPHEAHGMFKKQIIRSVSSHNRLLLFASCPEKPALFQPYPVRLAGH